MEDTKTSELCDYKFLCFYGVEKVLFVASERQKEEKKTKFDFFDMDYNHLPVTNGHSNVETPSEKPLCFDQMKVLAEKLSAGTPTPNYKDAFEKLLSEHEGYICYGGVLDFDKTTDSLRGCFALLFPTYYNGEGFPGNVVDAYNAALPIIATDWLYNKDVIADGVNGILIPIKSASVLREVSFSFIMIGKECTMWQRIILRKQKNMHLKRYSQSFTPLWMFDVIM